MKFSEIKKAVHKLDPALSEDDQSFKAMAVCLASAVCGPNVVKLRKYTVMPAQAPPTRGFQIGAEQVTLLGR